MRMVSHVPLSSEDVVVVAADTDIFILIFMRIQNTWFNKDSFLDTRMKNVLILKQFSFILIHYCFVLSLLRTESFIFERFS